MNFLLYMLGRASQPAPALRPNPRQQLMIRATKSAAHGDFPAALAAYRTLSDNGPSTPLDILIRAHLHLVCHENVEAALHFAEGLTRLHQTRASDPLTPTALELLLHQGDDHLNHGRYAQATAAIRRARALLDVLLAAEAGLWLTCPLPTTAAALQSLSHLSDLTLRLLARTQIADHLAGALRERHLADILAPWATSSDSVQSLLETQLAQLQHHAAALPGHVKNRYRLALVCRALGHIPLANNAFQQVLALHPHHIASAVRLAAADPAGHLDTLRQAFLVPSGTLQLFAQFANAAQDPRAFDDLADPLADFTNPVQTLTRANLAFALSELSLLDESRAPWREPAPV